MLAHPDLLIGRGNVLHCLGQAGAVFASYDDAHGYLKGDVPLKTIARLFSSQLRSSDIIARFGGDEFVVILPEANRRKASAIADRISEAVAAFSFGDVGLSASIGVASYRTGLTPEQLLDEADQDIYHRKRNVKGTGPLSLKQATSAAISNQAYENTIER